MLASRMIFADRAMSSFWKRAKSSIDPASAAIPAE
jgi:hypothetical protein